MSFPERVAILLDGEFAKRALQKGRKRFPTAEDVMAEVRRLLSADPLRSLEFAIEPGDIVPKVQQKGVDMRIGLDIASLALKRLVSTIVLVTGDSDLVPAMKLARREGLRVYLDTLGSLSVRAELKIHADQLL